MGAILATGPILDTRHPTPIRHIFTVTPRIAEELASTFTLDLPITAIDTADPDISIIGITAGIVIGKAIVVAMNLWSDRYPVRSANRTRIKRTTSGTRPAARRVDAGGGGAPRQRCAAGRCGPSPPQIEDSSRQRRCAHRSTGRRRGAAMRAAGCAAASPDATTAKS